MILCAFGMNCRLSFSAVDGSDSVVPGDGDGDGDVKITHKKRCTPVISKAR